MSHRIAKINSFLANEISQILSKEISFKPGVLVSVSKVETSPDLRHSRILISILPAEEEHYVLVTLKKELFFIQKALNQKMSTRILPRLTFVADQRPEKISQIEELFQKINREKEMGEEKI